MKSCWMGNFVVDKEIRESWYDQFKKIGCVEEAVKIMLKPVVPYDFQG